MGRGNPGPMERPPPAGLTFAAFAAIARIYSVAQPLTKDYYCITPSGV